MNWNIIGTILAAITLAVTLFGFFQALKSEMKKNIFDISKSKIEGEKRHASHERRLALIEERLTLTESAITYRLDEINVQIARMSGAFYDNLGNRQNEQ